MVIPEINEPLFFVETIHISEFPSNLSVREMTELSKWCLLGIPDQEGVMHVGGRLGTALGPRAFRAVFSRLQGRDKVLESLAADVDLPLTHRQAADAIRDLHRQFRLSVIVGGGNDHSYSQLMGIREAVSESKRSTRLGCINIDSHLDVRKPVGAITSGSPFYVAMESGVLDPRLFVEFGIQHHCNGPELWTYIESKKVKVVPFEGLRHGKAARAFAVHLKRLAAKCDAIVISLDLDAAAAAFAPGVSAPQAEGLDASDILEMMEISGAERKVVSLGIYELNPLHDADDRTARLAATAAYHFVAEAMKRKRRR